MIVKYIAVLLLELVIFYIIGTGITVLVYRKRQLNMGFRVIFGFLVYQVLFEVLTLYLTLKYYEFDTLMAWWKIELGITLALTLACGFRRVLEDIKGLLKFIKESSGWCVLALVVCILVCIYVSVNGELNEDSEYYIGLVSTAVVNQYLYRHNVYTGELLPSLYARRMFSTFEMNTAVLCRLFDLAPIIAMRVMRGSMNVVLTGISVFELSKRVFRKKDHLTVYAWKMVTAVYVAYFVCEKTMYMSGEFFLHRAYEGKAYAGSVLLFFTLCMAHEYKEHHRLITLVLWDVSLWGCLAISSSALIICGVESVIVFVVIEAERLLQKRQKGTPDRVMS